LNLEPKIRFPSLLVEKLFCLDCVAEIVGAFDWDDFVDFGDLGDDGEVISLTLFVDVAVLREGADQIVVHARGDIFVQSGEFHGDGDGCVALFTNKAQRL